MKKVSAIRLRQMGDIIYTETKNLQLSYGEKIVVEADSNQYLGTVLLSEQEIKDEEYKGTKWNILRKATQEDFDKYTKNLQREKEGIVKAKQLIKQNELEMKVVDFEYSLDGKKLLINFTADDRVDFRKLVKELAATFKARIELRQIGVRDEAKVLGGIGGCGRPFCCATHLTEFAPTTIKMAKDQNLSLNPTKISGTCGRLMCCLNNEEDTYVFLNKEMPIVGQNVVTKEGNAGVVQSINILNQTAKVIITLPGDEKELKEYKACDLKFKKGTSKKKNNPNGQNQDATSAIQKENLNA